MSDSITKKVDPNNLPNCEVLAFNGTGDNYGYSAQMARYKLAVIGNIYQNPELLESK